MPPSFPSEHPIIAVAGMAMHGVDGQILHGIQAYGHMHRWQIFNANTSNGRAEMLRNQRFITGVIAVVADDDSCRELKKMKCPVINISDTFPKKYGFPSVLPDDQRIGEIAAEYFLDRGYQNFAAHMLPDLHPYRYLNTRTATPTSPNTKLPPSPVSGTPTKCNAFFRATAKR